MRRLALPMTIGVVMLTMAQAAAESRFERSMRRLAPTERLVQLCDYTAMQRIRKENHEYRPDRAVADATAQTRIVKNSVEAKGAAFRSRGKWYGLSYSCTTAPDNMKVLSFSYKIGTEIPESKWASYGLWQ
jgi:hypothetical protein